MSSNFRCIGCNKIYPIDTRLRCECGELLEVKHNFNEVNRKLFDQRYGLIQNTYFSGVWRFKELIHPDIAEPFIVTRPEGNTNQYEHRILKDYTNLKNIFLKHEGENPTGSFKDRGMTVGISEAKRLGVIAVACASTGNTSASLSAYAAQAGLKCVVFIPDGEIAYGKLAQALAYGAIVLQVKGNFDDAMRIVEKASNALNLYLLNSVNPWRIEGQKTIIFELLQQRQWNPPDWIVVPAGNLGNTSAFGKALRELESLELIKDIPQIVAVQAEGANPFYTLWNDNEKSINANNTPNTIASAIKIGNPVSWRKALKTISETHGLVEQVSDQEIMDAKAMVDKSGVGCEPASAASVAGAKKLVETGIIDSGDTVVCILTGNLLKDPDSTVHYHTGVIEGVWSQYANKPVIIEPELPSVGSITKYLHKALNLLLS